MLYEKFGEISGKRFDKRLGELLDDNIDERFEEILS